MLIVCQIDAYANALKPAAVKEFLEERGHDVRLVDTYHLARASSDTASVLNKLPALQPTRALLYLVKALSSLVARRRGLVRRSLSYHLLIAEHRLRKRILRTLLELEEFDIVICETPQDSGVLTAPRSARTLYDCPTPWADELYYEERLTRRQHRAFRALEAKLFDTVDVLSFHWESYARHVLDHYETSGDNLITLNFGCTPAPERAAFDTPLKIVYLGSLSSRFIDLPLLARLTRLYPHIDVYGGPEPDPRLRLNYLGYAPPTILSRYQAGLITCTKDELRRNGFSAKHLEYFAHGLPVLVPAWRRHLELLPGSIPYVEHSFRSVVDELSRECEWRRASDVAYEQAHRYSWEKTLRPLETVLDG